MAECLHELVNPKTNKSSTLLRRNICSISLVGEQEENGKVLDFPTETLGFLLLLVYPTNISVY